MSGQPSNWPPLQDSSSFTQSGILKPPERPSGQAWLAPQFWGSGLRKMPVDSWRMLRPGQVSCCLKCHNLRYWNALWQHLWIVVPKNHVVLYTMRYLNARRLQQNIVFGKLGGGFFTCYCPSAPPGSERSMLQTNMTFGKIIHWTLNITAMCSIIMQSCHNGTTWDVLAISLLLCPRRIGLHCIVYIAFTMGYTICTLSRHHLGISYPTRFGFESGKQVEKTWPMPKVVNILWGDAFACRQCEVWAKSPKLWLTIAPIIQGRPRLRGHEHDKFLKHNSMYGKSDKNRHMPR